MTVVEGRERKVAAKALPSPGEGKGRSEFVGQAPEKREKEEKKEENGGGDIYLCCSQ